MRDFLRYQAGNMWTAFTELTIDELQEARNVAANYSTTNCWFAEYMMKDAFLKMIDDRISVIKGFSKNV